MTDLDPDTRALLDAARAGDDPSEDDRRRVKRALAASVAAGVAFGAAREAAASLPTGAVASAASGTVAKVGLWLSLGLAAGLATSGSLVAISQSTRSATDALATSPTPQQVAPRSATEAATEAAPPSLAPAGVPVTEAPVGVTSAPTAAATPATRAEPRSAPASTLAVETALIESARAALGRGDAVAALRVLDEHEQRFPQGALVEERLASRVFALCGLGRRADASRAAAELLRRAPASPLRGRVQASCAGRD